MQDTNRFRRVQLLRADSVQFGIFADNISQIVPWRQPTPLPHAPKSVMGVVSIQGRMLTVLNLVTILDSRAAAGDQSHQHILALRGDEQLALAVETLGENIEIDEEDIRAKPGTGEPLVLGVLHREGAEITILDPEELFSTAIQGRERRRRRF